jgi:hypothetical protein
MSSNNFSVGDRCQWLDDDTDEVTGGVVEAILPPKKPKPRDWYDSSKYTEADRLDFITYANVKWDDNTTDAADIDDLSEEDSELEKQFRQTASKALKLINAKVAEADAALSEACKIADKYGVPFDSGISFIRQSYSPDTTEEKFPELDRSFIDEVTGASNEYGYGGWAHSQVC